MSLPTQTKAWVVQNKPVKDVDLSSSPSATFALKTTIIPSSIPEDSLLVKTLYLSNDPAQRIWIQKDAPLEKLYAPPVKDGEIMQARGIGQILKVGGESDTTYKEGDLVVTSLGWSEYAVVTKASSRIISPVPGLSLPVFLGMFGGTGLTAYWGLTDILKLKAGETLIVSGAAGATGNVVVQLAKKVIGAKKVIAIVGSDEKGEWIKGLGADIVVNYKHPNWRQELINATPDFVETYFDNVGGDMLDFVLSRMKTYGRIAACGAISTYNNPASTNLTNYSVIVTNRLTIQGFLVLDYIPRREGINALRKAYDEGKLINIGGETIVKAATIEDVPKIWYRLFEGKNIGKLVTEMP